MKTFATVILAVAAAAMAIDEAAAQTAGTTLTTPMPGTAAAEGRAPRTTVTVATNGVSYMNGGANIDDADYLKARIPEFAMAFVFSGRGGEYGVADKLTLLNGDQVVLAVPNAGPYMLVKVPPGRYTAEAVFKGVVEKRTVVVGNSVTRVNWNTVRASD